MSTIALLQSGVMQIKERQDKLQKLYKEVREEYNSCKRRTERKDLMHEIEQIENESKLRTTTAVYDDLMFKLIVRVDEAKCDVIEWT